MAEAATALIAAADRPAQLLGAEPLVWSEVERLCAEHTALWWDCPSDTPRLGEPTSRRRQRANERAARRLIDELSKSIAAYPDRQDQRLAWRRTLQEKIQQFGEERLGWPQGYRDLLFGDDFFTSSVLFARRARAFDPAIALDDLGQALRNVWIMNSLQMLLGVEVAFTPAIFAYSMLYPYTDNFLDDPTITAHEKRDASGRLRRRLTGEAVAPRSHREEHVHRLVETIEEQYCRAAYPEVYGSLLAIHRAQTESLRQQSRARSLSDADLLALSVAKGGSSVLADGYLTAGNMDSAHADFCFGYGVFLQLLDDLQDVRSDRAAGHDTLFTRAAAAGPLDRITSRLHRLVDRVLSASPFADSHHAQPLDLIRRNCISLLVGAVAENRRLFSRRFVAELESGWPLSCASLRRLRRHLRKRQEKTASALRRRRGIDSLWDLL